MSVPDPFSLSLPEVLTTQTAPPELTGKIDIHHVSFRYREDGPLVLRDVSLGISSGEFVAVVGPSGSGKSTLFRLLLGFEGAIYYDGQDLSDLDVEAVRRQVGVVLENARLMTGSIFRNIVGGGSSPSMMLGRPRVWRGLRMTLNPCPWECTRW